MHEVFPIRARCRPSLARSQSMLADAGANVLSVSLAEAGYERLGEQDNMSLRFRNDGISSTSTLRAKRSPADTRRCGQHVKSTLLAAMTRTFALRG